MAHPLLDTSPDKHSALGHLPGLLLHWTPMLGGEGRCWKILPIRYKGFGVINVLQFLGVSFFGLGFGNGNQASLFFFFFKSHPYSNSWPLNSEFCSSIQISLFYFISECFWSYRPECFGSYRPIKKQAKTVLEQNLTSYQLGKSQFYQSVKATGTH